jgi:recombination protein RecA
MSVRPFDASKFRKSITKSIDGLGIGFNDPTDWISTGNYALNYLISGAFDKGIPLGKVTVFAGESGSGKSYICAGNIIRNAQAADIFPILIDTENALDEAWLQALGVDTREDKMLKLSLCMIDDVAKTISEFMKEYKQLPDSDRPKILFVVDSLGMLLTPTDINQFEAGDLKGDMGRKPKALNALVRNCVNQFGSYNVGMVATNHTYASQDPYNPDPNISGGQGFIYASSIVVAMKKLKLKEDEDGNKTTTVNGIRAGCKIMKTRYAKPFETIEVQIPYEQGMSLYSGLFDMLEARKLVLKEGNKYAYIDINGVVHKYFRKEWNQNTNGILDLVMAEFFKKPAASSESSEEGEGEE